MDKAEEIMLSKNKITKLYSDLNFPGSYYGAHNFYSELVRKYGKKEVPDYKSVLRILEDISTYQIHAQYREVKYFRPLSNVTGQGISLQVDLAFMPEVENYKGFLIAVDEWNNFIYTIPFINKSQGQIRDVLDTLFSLDTLRQLAVLSSDKGTEFTSNVKYVSSKGIKWLFLQSSQKAFLAEIYIRIVKGKLYRAMRDKKTIDWPTLLPQVTMSINASFSQFLGMSPLNSNSPEKDPIIRKKWEERKAKYEQEVARKLSQESKWKVGNFVYKKLKSSSLYKGYEKIHILL